MDKTSLHICAVTFIWASFEFILNECRQLVYVHLNAKCCHACYIITTWARLFNTVMPPWSLRYCKLLPTVIALCNMWSYGCWYTVVIKQGFFQLQVIWHFHYAIRFHVIKPSICIFVDCVSLSHVSQRIIIIIMIPRACICVYIYKVTQFTSITVGVSSLSNHPNCFVLTICDDSNGQFCISEK